jgi:hypothetical protein
VYSIRTVLNNVALLAEELIFYSRRHLIRVAVRGLAFALLLLGLLCCLLLLLLALALRLLLGLLLSISMAAPASASALACSADVIPVDGMAGAARTSADEVV